MQKKFRLSSKAAISSVCVLLLLISNVYSEEKLTKFISDNSLEGPFNASVLLYRFGESRERIIFQLQGVDSYLWFYPEGFHPRFKERKQVLEVDFDINKAGKFEILNERKIDEIHVRTVRYSVTHYMTHAFYRYFPKYHEEHDAVIEGADPFEGPTTKGKPAYSKMLDPEISLREYFKSGGYDLSHPNSGVFFDGEKLVFMSTAEDVEIFDKRLASLNKKHNKSGDDNSE